jgi:hypothetical protein
LQLQPLPTIDLEALHDDHLGRVNISFETTMANWHSKKFQPLVYRLSLPWLLIIPALLAIAGVVIAVVHSDLNLAALWSQCHARQREPLPFLSRVPVLGTPSCYMVSFFQFATASVVAVARMSIILAFVGALLTVSLVESVREANRGNVVIARPTLPWLLFNLVGGVLVWDLIIVPAFLRRAKTVQAAKESASGEAMRTEDPEIDREVRGLSSQVEAVAIPVSVALGFVLPSMIMLVLNDPVAILVWLFFPLGVGIIRWVVELVGMRMVTELEIMQLETRPLVLAAVYALPVLTSIVAQVLFFWSSTLRDDRKEMTRSTLKFIEIDFLLIGATVLYWVLVEGGVFAAAALAVVSLVLGPGAGLSVAWYLRERAIENYDDGLQSEYVEPRANANEADATEETPLIQ